MISLDEAMEAVAQMELLAYFNLSPEARVLVGKELMAMVNWPRERVVCNGYGVVPYVEPKDRLSWLMCQIRKLGAWPGMGEIRGIYCLKFTPADGIVAECDRAALGVTDDGVLIGNDPDAARLSAAEPLYLPQPGDEPIGDALLADIAGAAKRLGGGK